MICPECKQELGFFDTIQNTNTGDIVCALYTYENEECDRLHDIFNDLTPDGEGDPFGVY